MEEALKQGMAAWRKQHRKATLREIEAELDRRVASMRAALLEETIAMSAAVEGEAGVSCPVCGGALASDGKRRRRLRTNGEQEIKMEREYMRCPRCGKGFFPPG
jgi:YgiT-type zinc finger domain-containing protein